MCRFLIFVLLSILFFLFFSVFLPQRHAQRFCPVIFPGDLHTFLYGSPYIFVFFYRSVKKGNTRRFWVRSSTQLWPTSTSFSLQKTALTTSPGTWPATPRGSLLSSVSHMYSSYSCYISTKYTVPVAIRSNQNFTITPTESTIRPLIGHANHIFKARSDHSFLFFSQ